MAQFFSFFGSLCVLAWITLLFLFKLSFTLTRSALVGKSGGRLIAPEDKKLRNNKINDNESHKPLNDDNSSAFNMGYRWHRIATNDLENIPIALIIFWANMLPLFIIQIYYNNKTVSDYAAIIMFSSSFYFIFRIGFMVCYLYGLQPWRSVSFGFGQISTLIAGVNLIIMSIKLLKECETTPLNNIVCSQS